MIQVFHCNLQLFDSEMNYGRLAGALLMKWSVRDALLACTICKKTSNQFRYGSSAMIFVEWKHGNTCYDSRDDQ